MTKAVAEVLHYPRLDTVLMVEEAIKNAQDYPTKAKLMRMLPKKIMYQTLLVILDYLQSTGKIYIEKKTGWIAWTWDPEGIRQMRERGLMIR
ncbi:MAG: hypothetical protein NTY83_00690 [Candidatus Micrarchaeota archaeon]|nr:hypothetical protein [Candidatus Micrarchaeota archaeon]